MTLCEAAQEDIDYVESNFREGERRGQMLADAEDERTLVSDHEQCWTVRAANGDILGYLGVLTLPDNSYMSNMRGISYMSCANVDRHVFSFVKGTLAGFRWMVEQVPPWVDTFRSWPPASFERSVAWQKRMIGMREIGRVPVKDDFLVILETTRDEIMSFGKRKD
jgi:hypothetical protein